MMGALAAFNEATVAEAQRTLLQCCGACEWARAVAVKRPYGSKDALLEAAEREWFGRGEEDWLEAFACHPRIGEKKAASTEYLASSSREQAEAQRTLGDVADALAEGNRLYEERFGFRYIVFASGRSAAELLRVLEERLTHTRGEELMEAARQQQRITRLRMTQWLGVETGVRA